MVHILTAVLSVNGLVLEWDSRLCPNFHFQMYGRYTKDLGEYAKEEARKVKALERKRKKEDRLRNKELQKYRGKCASKLIAAFSFVWRHTFARLGEDWVFLALLGIIMAFISFLMDRGISICNQGIVKLFSCVHLSARNEVYLSHFVVTLACTQMIHISVTCS